MATGTGCLGEETNAAFGSLSFCAKRVANQAFMGVSAVYAYSPLSLCPTQNILLWCMKALQPLV